MQEEEEPLGVDVEPVPKRVRKLRRKPAEHSPAFRQLSAVQLSGSVGHTLAQMRQAFEAGEDEAGAAQMTAQLPYDGAAQHMGAAEEGVSEAQAQSDVESGELVASPPRGGKETAAADDSDGASGAVVVVEQHLRSDEGVRIDSHIEKDGLQSGSMEGARVEEAEERSERRRKHSTGEKRKMHRSDRSDSRGRERKEARRQEKEREGGRKHTKRHRRSQSRSVSPPPRRRHHRSSIGVGASGSSESDEHGSKRSRPGTGRGIGTDHVPAVPGAGLQVSDALRARVRAMLESVAPK